MSGRTASSARTCSRVACSGAMGTGVDPPVAPASRRSADVFVSAHEGAAGAACGADAAVSPGQSNGGYARRGQGQCAEHHDAESEGADRGVGESSFQKGVVAGAQTVRRCGRQRLRLGVPNRCARLGAEVLAGNTAVKRLNGANTP